MIDEKEVMNMLISNYLAFSKQLNYFNSFIVSGFPEPRY